MTGTLKKTETKQIRLPLYRKNVHSFELKRLRGLGLKTAGNTSCEQLNTFYTSFKKNNKCKRSLRNSIKTTKGQSPPLHSPSIQIPSWTIFSDAEPTLLEKQSKFSR